MHNKKKEIFAIIRKCLIQKFKMYAKYWEQKRIILMSIILISKKRNFCNNSEMSHLKIQNVTRKMLIAKVNNFNAIDSTVCSLSIRIREKDANVCELIIIIHILRTFLSSDVCISLVRSRANLRVVPLENVRIFSSSRREWLVRTLRKLKRIIDYRYGTTVIYCYNSTTLLLIYCYNSTKPPIIWAC